MKMSTADKIVLVVICLVLAFAGSVVFTNSIANPYCQAHGFDYAENMGRTCRLVTTCYIENIENGTCKATGR